MRAELQETQAELAAARAALERMETALSRAVERSVQPGFKTSPIAPGPTELVSEHRRLPRSGRPAIIDVDPELRVFLEVRMDRTTFEEMAADVTAQFPEDRRVRRSVIHRWARRSGLIPKARR